MNTVLFSYLIDGPRAGIFGFIYRFELIKIKGTNGWRKKWNVMDNKSKQFLLFILFLYQQVPLIVNGSTYVEVSFW